MSDQKKFKDLLARLVAMTPDPPPYPEEMTMAKHEEPRSPRPWLVFAGAAALVALLAIPVVLLTRGDAPDAIADTTTTTTQTTTTAEPSTTSTLGPTTTTLGETSTTTSVTGWTGVWFLYQEPENAYLGNPALVPIRVGVTAPPGVLDEATDFSSAMTALLDSGEPLPGGLFTAIPAGVVVEDVSSSEVDGRTTFTVEMSDQFSEGAGGLLADTTMLNQLIYNLTIDDPAAAVLFTVEGTPVTEFGSEGLDLSGAVDRETFIDSLNLIFLTEPITAVEHVYVVFGRANTFEASLSVQVLDATGGVVHEEFTTATCGSGCWGEYGFGISTDLVVPGETSVRVFEYSAEDGSISHAVTIPIPAGTAENPDVWQIDLG